MDSTQSFLRTVIARIRGYNDSPSQDGKFNDAFIVSHIISPSFETVLSRVSNSTSEPVSLWIPFPLESGVAVYALPPCVAEVWHMGERGDDGTLIREAIPRGNWNWRGPNWAIEGNSIVFTPEPAQDYDDLEMHFMPSGRMQPFIASGTLSAGKDTVTIAVNATPTLGLIDRRDSAYAGCMMRLLPTGGVVEERIVETWELNGSSFVGTLRKPFTSATAGTVTFEMAPYGLESLYEAVAVHGAIKLGAYRGMNAGQREQLKDQYKDAMKTAVDFFQARQMRKPKSFERGTVDNPGWNPL